MRGRRGKSGLRSKRKIEIHAPGPSASAFTLKLVTSGDFKCVGPCVGSTVNSVAGYSAAQSVALDGSGNVIVGGYYDNSVDFNPGSGTTMLPTIGGGYITKLNSSGGLVWARALQSVEPVFVYGLDVDAAGAVYAAGAFHGETDFDPSGSSFMRTPAGEVDAFVLKLTPTGNLDWTETFGGTGNDVALGLAVDSMGVIHLAGYFQQTVDFDPDPLETYYLTAPSTVSRAFRLRLRQV